mgnify:CR=1 FL=1
MSDAPTLAAGLYLAPTSLGALHAVTATHVGPAEHLIRALLQQPKALLTDDADLCALAGVGDTDTALTVLALAQDAGWIEGCTDEPQIPPGPLGRELPALLAPLSDVGQAALVDDQGFSLSSVGFTAETEAELAVLAAEVVSLQRRRTTFAASPTAASGWGLVDRHGATTIAIFPLAIGDQPFVLILGGLPRLNHPSFVQLVTALSRRYAPTSDTQPDEPSAPQQAGDPHA